MQRRIDTVCLRTGRCGQPLYILEEAIRPHEQAKVFHTLDQGRHTCLAWCRQPCPCATQRERTHQQPGIQENAQEIVHLAELDRSVQAPQPVVVHVVGVERRSAWRRTARLPTLGSEEHRIYNARTSLARPVRCLLGSGGREGVTYSLAVSSSALRTRPGRRT